MILPVILAGGTGSRLWPLSRKHFPKQFLALMNENTLLQNTLERLDGMEALAPPLVVCNEAHRFMVAEQLYSLGGSPRDIILEPVGRDTAPALAAAALRARTQDEDPLLLVLPADHVITDVPAFQGAVNTGAKLARQGKLVTFGIPPQSPETGYGYIKGGPSLDHGARTIEAFVEKPDLKTAKTYVDSGEYCWNSGMFLFRCSDIIGAFKSLAPEILAACTRAVDQGISDLDFFRLDQEAFEASPKDSIDYAIMEKTHQGAMVPLAAGWNDVGAWEAVWQMRDGDSQGNVTQGDVMVQDVKNSLLFSESRMIAGMGLKDMIVVETKDAVLVAPRERSQEVKTMVETLKAQGRSESSIHTRVVRPWGAFEGIDAGERFQVKRITVNPGSELSLQKHFHRAEHWVVVKGTAKITKGEETFLLREDQSTYIPLGTVHRLENPGKIPLELIEVQSGPYLGEDDIVRLEDHYGRTSEGQSPQK